MMTLNEMTIHYSQGTDLTPFKILSSQSAHELLREAWAGDMEIRERFYVIYLNNSNQVKGVSLISVGGITGTTADVRLILGPALKSLSTAIILAHNHPSGKLKPSTADLALTNKVKEAGQLMDIAVLDHVILNAEYGYFSFADEGRL